MPRMPRFYRPIPAGLSALAVVALTFSIVATTARPVAAEEPEVVEAPAFTLPTLEGRPVSLSDFQGQVVLIDFWATWCGPCHRLMNAEIAPLHQALRDRGDFKLIGISNEDVGTQRGFLSQHQGYDWLTLQDTGGMITRSYGVRGIPSLALVSRTGELISFGNGFQQIGAIKGYLAKELGVSLDGVGQSPASGALSVHFHGGGEPGPNMDWVQPAVFMAVIAGILIWVVMSNKKKPDSAMLAGASYAAMPMNQPATGPPAAPTNSFGYTGQQPPPPQQPYQGMYPPNPNAPQNQQRPPAPPSQPFRPQ